MFIDSARIYLKAGNGGDGCVSFHREKYVPAGGPDGGDGGNGGDLVFLGDGGMHTLSDFRYQTKYQAEHGENGRPSNCTGKSGSPMVIRVPLGTAVFEAETGKLIADIVSDGQKTVIIKGGKGGAGNQHFATPTRQIPDFAKSGEKGQEMTVDVELKVLADVGLVGLPNVGKSTLLSVVSSARPKIADYHFTTLTPNLGVVDIGDGNSFVVADIPGLIEGAHTGLGLGDDFLRHIERTRLLLHVVDVAGVEGRNPINDFHVINEELKNYKVNLSCKPMLVVANKTDVLGLDGQDKLEHFRSEIEQQGYRVFEISAATGLRVRELMAAAWEILTELPEDSERIAGPVSGSGLTRDNDAGKHPGVFGEGGSTEAPGYLEYRLKDTSESEKRFEINIENGVYIISGKWVVKLVADTNFNSHESVQYFQRMLKKYGAVDRLEKMGIREGDTVRIDSVEFDYIK